MDALRLNLVFEIGEPLPAEDIDQLTDLIREALDDCFANLDFIDQSITASDIDLEIL